MPAETRATRGPLLQRAAELRDERVRGEYARRLAGARLIFIDHDLVQRDLPALRDERLLRAHPPWRRRPAAERAALLARERERLLLARAAVVSGAQAAQHHVQRGLRLRPGLVRAWRPPRYGRALVVSLPGGGLLDLKGVGVAPTKRPQRGAHLTGLCTLSELLYGVVVQWALDALFARQAPDLFTVPMYALIDPGFDCWQPRLRTFEPAAIQVRRAHRRPRGGIELPRLGTRLERVKLEIELLLRRYGLTSANPATRLDLTPTRAGVRVAYGLQPVRGLRPRALRLLLRRTAFDGRDLRLEGLNVQLTREIATRDARAQLVDFGHFQVRRRFADPLASLAYKRVLRFGRALRPDDARFARPDPRRRFPWRAWQPNVLIPEMDALARAVRGRALDRAQLLALLRAKVDQVAARW